MTESSLNAVPLPPTVVPRKRLLLLKFGAIGDVMMAIPAAAAMHAAGYSIDWVAGEAVAPLLSLYPWIRVIPVNEARLLRGGKARRLQHVFHLWRRLWSIAQNEPYDLCATLYYDPRYRLLSRPIRARRRLNLSWSERATRLLPGRHHTDEYARILTGRLDTEIPVRLAPVPTPNLPPNPLHPVPGAKRIVLVPAGAKNLLRDDALRRWPVEAYVELAHRLLAAGCEVVLAGGPEDTWASPWFARLGQDFPERLRDALGRFTLIETLALFESATVTVTHDTGPLHMAGLTTTSIVTIFGPTDPRGRLPQRENCVALWGGEGFACRPCYDGRNYAACTHNGCIREVTPAMVSAEVEEAIRNRREGRNLPPRVLVPAAAMPVALLAGIAGLDRGMNR